MLAAELLRGVGDDGTAEVGEAVQDDRVVDAGDPAELATVLQATTKDNPLYSDGFQWSDISRMWDASGVTPEVRTPWDAVVPGLGAHGADPGREIGVGRSLVNFIGQAPRTYNRSQPDYNPHESVDYASWDAGLRPNFNPYDITDENAQKLNNNFIYNGVTGLSDAAWNVGSGKFVGALATKSARGAGFASDYANESQMSALKNQIDVHQDPVINLSTN